MQLNNLLCLMAVDGRGQKRMSCENSSIVWGDAQQRDDTRPQTARRDGFRPPLNDVRTTADDSSQFSLSSRQSFVQSVKFSRTCVYQPTGSFGNSSTVPIGFYANSIFQRRLFSFQTKHTKNHRTYDPIQRIFLPVYIYIRASYGLR